ISREREARPRRSEPVEKRLVRGTRRQPAKPDCRAAARLKRTKSWLHGKHIIAREREARPRRSLL
ncbi:MAG: hypothetical protein ACYCYC_12225, partial [Bellilinea sp.]